MQLACPHCEAPIPAADVNVVEDTALCRRCGRGLAYSELIHAEDYSDIDPLRPPAGCWHWSDGIETRIGASCRSLSAAVVLLLIAAFWNGLSWFFMLAGAAGIANRVAPGSVPAHLIPTSGGSPMSLVLALVMVVFMIPFVGIGLLILYAFFNCLFGRIEVRVRTGEGEVRNGIGALGSRKRFSVAAVRRVRQRTKKRKDSDGGTLKLTQVVIEADRTLDFGGDLPEERRRFLTGMLRRTLMRDAA